jgi:hypothetical protein
MRRGNDAPHNRHRARGFRGLHDGILAPRICARIGGRLPIKWCRHISGARVAAAHAQRQIDRRALTDAARQEEQPEALVSRSPALAAPALVSAADAASDVEAQLAGIWRELLGVANVRPDDCFFALGGHSLLAVRLAFQIERRFRAHLTLLALFEHRHWHAWRT